MFMILKRCRRCSDGISSCNRIRHSTAAECGDFGVVPASATRHTAAGHHSGRYSGELVVKTGRETTTSAE